MASLDPWQRQLSDLQLDLRIERDKLSELVGSLERLEGRMQAGSASSETFDSAALRHLYAYELEADRVRQLLQRAIAMWPGIEADLGRFQAWLDELMAE
ncbi:hypothetical protein KBY82_03235 [Cyanobium sp. AMD-g]|uniref:hypothetical protein n=1 Tax=Cyanobium sp. AMD-g TaxID=2823699 RepID=UPI0020CC8D42|nr:hypothetical protein [Cyanobium sp. AMD-g]MCP9929792.1 hypothetical protein [Cyanobium sp. AMD-g]